MSPGAGPFFVVTPLPSLTCSAMKIKLPLVEKFALKIPSNILWGASFPIDNHCSTTEQNRAKIKTTFYFLYLISLIRDYFIAFSQVKIPIFIFYFY